MGLSDRVSRIWEEEIRSPTRWSRVLENKIHRRPPEQSVRSSGSVGSSGWVGSGGSLDSPTREKLQQLDPALLEAYLDTFATTSSLPPITCTYERQRRRHADPVSLWLDGVYFDVTWSLWALLDGVEFLPPQGSWCGHHMMAHLWRLSLSFMLSLFGFIFSIGLVFEIVRIIVLVFEIV